MPLSFRRSQTRFVHRILVRRARATVDSGLEPAPPREASAVPSTQRPMANAFIRSIPEPDPFASRPIDSTRTFATSPQRAQTPGTPLRARSTRRSPAARQPMAVASSRAGESLLVHDAAESVFTMGRRTHSPCSIWDPTKIRRSCSRSRSSLFGRSWLRLFQRKRPHPSTRFPRTAGRFQGSPRRSRVSSVVQQTRQSHLARGPATH